MKNKLSLFIGILSTLVVISCKIDLQKTIELTTPIPKTDAKAPTHRKLKSEDVQADSNADKSTSKSKIATVDKSEERIKRSSRATIQDTAANNFSCIFDLDMPMPSFPGGDVALQKYIQSHTKYPRSARKQGIEGNVVVKFIVSKTGRVGKVKVLKSIDKRLDKEAIRVVKSLPAFTPGKYRGKPMNVWYTCPIIFRLH